MVIMGQYQMLSILKTKNEQLQKHSEKLYNDLRNDEVFKNTVEKLVNQGTKAVKDLEATVTQLSSEMKKKKTEDDACQKEKVNHFVFCSFSIGSIICLPAHTIFFRIQYANTRSTITENGQHWQLRRTLSQGGRV